MFKDLSENRGVSIEELQQSSEYVDVVHANRPLFNQRPYIDDATFGRASDVSIGEAFVLGDNRNTPTAAPSVKIGPFSHSDRFMPGWYGRRRPSP